jgi:FkbM family methyltransferase
MKYLASMRAIFSAFFALRREGNVRGAILFLLCSLLKNKRPIRVSFQSRHLMIRPCTPDLDVVQSCFSGELDAAISAASPLKYNFIIDAGGYIGTSAIVFAEAFPQAQIISLEPSEENFKVLSSNVKDYPNIMAVNQALGPTVGYVTLRDRGTGEWGFSIVDTETSTALYNVQLTTVPKVLQEFSEKGIDILKLDIEGGELELLRDCPHWIQKCRVIVAELHDCIVPGCEAVFRDAMRNRSLADCGSEKSMSVSVD